MIDAKVAREHSILYSGILYNKLKIIENKISNSIKSSEFSLKLDYILDLEIQKYITNCGYEVMTSYGDNTYTIINW